MEALTHEEKLRDLRYLLKCRFCGGDLRSRIYESKTKADGVYEVYKTCGQCKAKVGLWGGFPL